MDEQLARTIGERVRLHRVAARKPKTVIAGLSGISTDYLYQIERGLKLPTIAVLLQLAEVLGVTVDELLHPSPKRPPAVNAPAGQALYRALTAPVATDGVAVDPSMLRQGVMDAWTTWQTSASRYSQVTTVLPPLITDTERALRMPGRDGAGDRRETYRCAADLYALMRSVAKRLGRVDLALLAADRAIRAGEDADDPLRLAMSRWNLAQVLLADGEPEAAETVALHATETLKPWLERDLDAVALTGALLLVAAIAAARRGDAWRGRDHVRAAEPLAKRTGERNTLWTVFGPTNVAMHAVSVEVEAGAAADGLRLAEQVEHHRSPSIERRVAFLLDQAKGYEQRRDYASVLVMLSTTEHEAAEDLHYRPAAHSLLRNVVKRGRRSIAGEAAQLATRVGMPL